MLNFKEFLALDEIESIKVKRRDKFGYGGFWGIKLIPIWGGTRSANFLITRFTEETTRFI